MRAAALDLVLRRGSESMEDATALMAAALRDESPRVNLTALKALDNFPELQPYPEEFRRIMHDRLLDVNPQVREAAWAVVTSRGWTRDFIPELKSIAVGDRGFLMWRPVLDAIALADDSDPTVREHIADDLRFRLSHPRRFGSLDDESRHALAKLRDLIRDPSPEVRAIAISAVLQNGDETDKNAEALISSALRDVSPVVRRAALHAISDDCLRGSDPLTGDAIRRDLKQIMHERLLDSDTQAQEAAWKIVSGQRSFRGSLIRDFIPELVSVAADDSKLPIALEAVSKRLFGVDTTAAEIIVKSVIRGLLEGSVDTARLAADVLGSLAGHNEEARDALVAALTSRPDCFDEIVGQLEHCCPEAVWSAIVARGCSDAKRILSVWQRMWAAKPAALPLP